MSFQVQVHVHVHVHVCIIMYNVIYVVCHIHTLYLFPIPCVINIIIHVCIYSNSFVHVYFSGNHTFAAIRGKESYQLVGALSAVIGEVNSLVTSKSLAVLPGVTVEVVLGGDYKVNIHVHTIHTSGVASRHTISALYYLCQVLRVNLT